jgi:hypothetical protein
VVVGEAVAAGVVNRDQVEVILRSLARLPADIGVEVRDRAAAELVTCSAGLDPALLELRPRAETPPQPIPPTTLGTPVAPREHHGRSRVHG